MKTVVIVVGSAVVVVIAVVGVYFWYSMRKPLYEPGMVRAGENLRASLTAPQQPDDEPFWAVEADVQLYHFSEGDGRNVLVVHGGPGTPPMEPWPGLGPLAGDYAFHYYHQRGCGQSTRPIDTFASSNMYQNIKTLDQALGIGTQLADIERIRQILGEERLILVGHSFGGFLASLYAAEFPEHVDALVLIAPADVLVMPQEDGGLFELVKERLPAGTRAEYEAWLEEYLNFKDVFSKSETELAALNAEFGEYYAAVAEVPEAEQGEPGGWMVQAMYFSMGQQHDYRGALENVDAPVLVIHGAGDLQPEAASRAYVEAFPNARFQVIENASHFPFYEQPADFAASVGEFLDELK